MQSSINLLSFASTQTGRLHGINYVSEDVSGNDLDFSGYTSLAYFA